MVQTNHRLIDRTYVSRSVQAEVNTVKTDAARRRLAGNAECPHCHGTAEPVRWGGGSEYDPWQRRFRCKNCGSEDIYERVANPIRRRCIDQRLSNARGPAGNEDPEESQGHLAFPAQAAQEYAEAAME